MKIYYMAQIVKNKRSNRTSTVNNIVMPAQPSSSSLQDGEIALNYADGYETLFIKNDNGGVVSFSNDNTLLSAMAQYENVIDDVKLNGTSLPVTNKSVNVTALTAETYTHHETVTATPSTASSALTAGGTFTAINSIGINNGHVTGYTTETYTLPSGGGGGGGGGAVDSVNGKTGVVVLDSDDVGALPISGGTMTGTLVAQNNTAYTTKQVRNIFLSTGDPTSSVGANGDIWIKYST
jgi:hypothetical protein